MLERKFFRNQAFFRDISTYQCRGGALASINISKIHFKNINKILRLSFSFYGTVGGLVEFEVREKIRG